MNNSNFSRRRLLKFLGGAAIFGTAALYAKRSFGGNSYYTGPKSDHFDSKIFFNPEGVPPNKFADLLKWQFEGGKAKWPESRISPFAGAKPDMYFDDLRLTMIGHASILIQVDGVNILTDPVFSKRASPVSFAGPKRVTDVGVALDDLPKIDIILMTHNHYDHMDMDTLHKLVRRDDPLVLTPLGNDTILKNHVPHMRIDVGDWGDVSDLTIRETRIKAHFEPCHHWSARGTGDRRMALWCAFVLETSKGKIYHIGDTGFHSGINYKAAAEKHGGFRVACLPVGAYEPRWFMKGQHQNPEEAVQGFKLCKTQSAIGHHWGTFQLTNEALEAPRDDLITALEKAGIEQNRFVALEAGQSYEPAA